MDKRVSERDTAPKAGTMKLKQRLFVKEYLVDLNATRAATAAGYSEKTAYSQGQRLLKNVEVRAAIRQRLGKIFHELDTSAEHIIRELACVGFARMSDYIRVQGREAYIDLSALTDDQAAAITELTSDVLIRGTEKDDDGQGVPVQVKRTKIKLGGKLEALKMLGQYRKLFTEKVEHTGEEGSAIRIILHGEKKNVEQPP
jgi:phage terminase small subunit